MNKIDSQHVKKVFGKNVKYYRFLKKLTQEQLAEKIDIDITSISDIECGARGGYNLKQLRNFVIH